MPKESEVGDREMAGTLPVPDREMVEGLPGALCGIVSVPVCDPSEVGMKVTVTVWLEVMVPIGAASVSWVGVTTNIGLLEVMVPTDSVAVPVLEIVSIRVADESTATLPKESEVGEIEMAGWAETGA
ncbi:MAG: hypothetical protein A3F84_01740 [Candidatus Handelsmanbacteria bacterium RIFCSPLOWO2_12_FULL_64_10]|uniref:Uncharacterized protein n=1 Tax=Handelsmanbacteria sp. (strain RIFCSPLOWO2_12_FULL_64_10) TaxID=1817868 RepID=A0A1F6D2G1_HANXR|nr:MAG: hypothetical protein A3F84_01740 [Candidatus Handelsmanbacteria bacterium RIFCSPLOWO2_12_FULL_64_10]